MDIKLKVVGPGSLNDGCIKPPFLEIPAENFELNFFGIKPIEGYEAPINKETGEKFPNCCQFHKMVLEETQKWFLEFPNCCEGHKELLEQKI